jgi:hypothetical protein
MSPFLDVAKDIAFYQIAYSMPRKIQENSLERGVSCGKSRKIEFDRRYIVISMCGHCGG